MKEVNKGEVERVIEQQIYTNNINVDICTLLRLHSLPIKKGN